jgi:hypothetical protein
MSLDFSIARQVLGEQRGLCKLFTAPRSNPGNTPCFSPGNGFIERKDLRAERFGTSKFRRRPAGVSSMFYGTPGVRRRGRRRAEAQRYHSDRAKSIGAPPAARFGRDGSHAYPPAPYFTSSRFRYFPELWLRAAQPQFCRSLPRVRSLPVPDGSPIGILPLGPPPLRGLDMTPIPARASQVAPEEDKKTRY